MFTKFMSSYVKKSKTQTNQYIKDICVPFPEEGRSPNVMYQKECLLETNKQLLMLYDFTPPFIICPFQHQTTTVLVRLEL